MRKLFFLILIVAAAYFAYGRVWPNHALSGSPNPALSGALQFPSRIAWRAASRNPASAGQPAFDMVEVVAIDPNKWRTEATTTRRVFVAVFDGQHFACSNPQLTAEQVDPAKAIRQLFAALPRAKYEGTENLGGRPAWRFRGADFRGVSVTAWIDTQTRFLARVTATMPDGGTLDAQYTVLPVDLDRDGARIFDTRRHDSIFGSYLHFP